GARRLGEPRADIGELLRRRDRRTGDDPRPAGIDIPDARVVAVEPVAEAGLEDLKRRRVPAVTAQEREHALPLAHGGVSRTNTGGIHLGRMYSHGRIRSRRDSSSTWRARALRRSCRATRPTTCCLFAGLTTTSEVMFATAIACTAPRRVSAGTTTSAGLTS